MERYVQCFNQRVYMLTSAGPILIAGGNFEGLVCGIASVLTGLGMQRGPRFLTLGAYGILCCMVGAGNGGAECHGIRGEVNFLLVVLSSRTLFGVVASC